MTPQPDKAPLILIVEDDVVTRLTLAKVLAKSGYRTVEAENGQIGVSLYMSHKPAMILMDAVMPTMDGYEAIKAIRSYEQSRAIPILMLTALDNIAAIDQAFDAGATDFITKPINWGLLNQRVKYALRTAEIEEQLRGSQAQLQYAQKLAKLGYWEWDATSNEVSGSESAFSQFCIPKQPGISLEQFLSNVLPKDLPLINQAISEANQGQAHIEISFRILNPEGHLKHIECLGEVSFTKSGAVDKITGSAQDITRLHKAESLIHYQSQHDTLTDLPNRKSFSSKVKEFIQQQPSKTLCAVVIFDIDRFKLINSNLGQDLGDNLLLSLAQRLSRVIREADYAARLGSDEFAILIQNLHDAHELNLLLGRLSHDLNAPFVLNNQELFVSYSMGVSVSPEDATTAEELLTHANIARSTAKSQGGNQFVLYHANMNSEVQNLLTLENDLRRALNRGEIEVFYQPQVDTETLQPTGAEALVRWRHPQQGIISPVVFIPLAESTGLIIQIGKYVLECAVKEAEKWHQQGHTQMRIGVNLSGRQFTQSNLMEDVQQIISQSSLPAKFIDLEITESLAMSDAETNISILNGLKALGVALSIDDFGTGYSSLSYLHSFPIDTIKIDRSFILNLKTKEGRAIAKTILAMADSLNLEVVAEGIELDEQVAFFQGTNCDIFQGFKFGKPMPAVEFTAWLNNHKI
ncbi:MAG: EAL domain-containing protein [Gammaproteobacteria bacterium]|nr:EAL domain-containing protein [Gammaproteobacteria bacterium]